MACYGDSFTFLYIDYVETSQETHLQTSRACYGESFTSLYVGDVRTSQEARRITEIALRFFKFIPDIVIFIWNYILENDLVSSLR
jgi:hypothetical protein